MSLASLLHLYGSPGNQYATAKAAGDITAQTRMRLELATQVAAEIVPAAQDRILTGLQLNNSIQAYAIVFDGQPPFARLVIIPSQRSVTAKIRMGITRMEHFVGVLSTSLAQLRGEFPTAPGVLNAAEAIYPGTRVYTSWDNDGTWEVAVATVITDNGVAPIRLQIGALTATIARNHVFFELTEAQASFVIDQLALYQYMTSDGIGTFPIVTINAGVSIVLDNGPGTTTVLFADIVNATWVRDLAAEELIASIEPGQAWTNGPDTWDVTTVNGFPTATVILDDGSPAGLTVPFQDFVDGVWTLD